MCPQFFDLATNSVVENISNTNPYVVGSLLNTSAVNNAAALVIRGRGDGKETTEVDYEATESEEEDEADTTVLNEEVQKPLSKFSGLRDIDPPNNDDLKQGNKIIPSKILHVWKIRFFPKPEW